MGRPSLPRLDARGLVASGEPGNEPVGVLVQMPLELYSNQK